MPPKPYWLGAAHTEVATARGIKIREQPEKKRKEKKRKEKKRKECLFQAVLVGRLCVLDTNDWLVATWHSTEIR
jgi:hypothetical protein